jgi:hypothetical protein
MAASSSVSSEVLMTRKTPCYLSVVMELEEEPVGSDWTKSFQEAALLLCHHHHHHRRGSPPRADKSAGLLALFAGARVSALFSSRLPPRLVRAFDVGVIIFEVAKVYIIFFFFVIPSLRFVRAFAVG